MNYKRAIAGLAIAGTSLVGTGTTAHASALPSCGRGRIILTTSEVNLHCNPRHGQRVDVLIPADNFSEALDKCDWMGGWSKFRIFRMPVNFGGIQKNTPALRCNQTDF